jgi:citrate synthase
MATAKLSIDDKVCEFPIVEGSLSERAIDIAKLRAQTGLVTMDPGYGNTGSCNSAITFIDGEKGVLLYRGYPIEEMGKADFVEIAYLLIYGNLPKQAELQEFQSKLDEHSDLPEDVKKILEGFPRNGHPMSMMGALTMSLSALYHAEHSTPEATELDLVRLVAKTKAMAAYAYRRTQGLPYVSPEKGQSYAGDFLQMMFGSPDGSYEVNPVQREALNHLLVLHADHEQNCSTSTVRMVGSSGANVYASITAGICALWGPLHGGANQEVIEMLEMIQKDGSNYQKYVDMAKKKDSGFRLFGFGHRVYKNFDPRARILKEQADRVLASLGVNDPLLDLAKHLEEIALKDSYFVERSLYPNVDFYSGLIYRAMGIPTNMFTVMFTLGRMPGWIAQWKELHGEKGQRISRPRQIYTGSAKRPFVAIDQR